MDRVFMFLMDVALGNKIYNPTTFINRIPNGYTSCYAHAGKVTMGGGRILLNDEVVVYDVSQVNPVYLMEFSNS